MNYKLVNRKNKHGVLEIQTNQIIKLFDNRNDARDLLRHLNLGGGFDGWTPSFMIVC